MACGTPVIAFRAGSVPEVMDDGLTGFVVENEEEAVRAVGRVSELSRRRCREVFEKRFCAARMARDYLAVYRKLGARAGAAGNGDGHGNGKRRRGTAIGNPPSAIGQKGLADSR